MKTKDNPWFLLAAAWAVALVIWVGFDVVDYHSRASNTGYGWYDNRVLVAPYINLRCRLNPATKIIVSRDGAGGLWLERETKVGEWEFWTRICKIDECNLK